MTAEEAIAAEMRPTVRRAVRLCIENAERDGTRIDWPTFGPILARALAEYAARGDALRDSTPAGSA